MTSASWEGGRDLLTRPDGTVKVLDEATMNVVVDYRDAATVSAIETTPAVLGLSAVVGRSASAGFRAAVNAAIGTDIRGRVVYQLLDDIPVATLVSGYAIGVSDQHGGGDEDPPRRRPEGLPELQVADLCAGFQAGGTIMRSREDGSRGGGAYVTGPLAPSIERPDDPWAWHRFGALSPDGMRRRRRIDIHRSHDDPGLLQVEALFRDSHMGADGFETIVHEYFVDARVDLATMTFVHASATPRVLPWVECPQAAASAGRLAGRPVADLRPTVRAEFLGPTTCTHLTDTLRALEDVGVLSRSLPT